jgi:hypothetical protein
MGGPNWEKVSWMMTEIWSCSINAQLEDLDAKSADGQP